MAAACRLAVVGVGPLVGLPHAKRIAELDGAVLAAVCDLKPAAAMRQFGVPGYTNVAVMIANEDLHGVVIATPTHLHLPTLKMIIQGMVGKASLKAVLVEKPMCESVAAAQEFIKVAGEAGIKVLVGHQRRHSPSVQAARSIVSDRRKFGALRSFMCQWTLLKPNSYFESADPARAYINEKGKGGPILINMIHELDLIRFITGREISQVFASTSGLARKGDVEDTGTATLALDDGALGSVIFSDSTPSPWNYEFTTGENKKYPPLPDSAGKPDCYRFCGGILSLGFPSLRTSGYGDLLEGAEPGWDSALSVKDVSVEAADPLTAQMSHFLKVCAGIEEPVCTGADGLQAILAMLAIQRSADTGMLTKLSELQVESEAVCVPLAKKPKVQSVASLEIVEALPRVTAYWERYGSTDGPDRTSQAFKPTAEWLTQKLHVPVKECVAKEVEEKGWNGNRCFECQVTYAGSETYPSFGLPNSLLVKLRGPETGEDEFVPEAIVTHLVRYIPDPPPIAQIFWCGRDCLIMENMKDSIDHQRSEDRDLGEALQNMSSTEANHLKHPRNWSVDEAKGIVQSLAHVHATFWGIPDVEGLFDYKRWVNLLSSHTSQEKAVYDRWGAAKSELARKVRDEICFEKLFFHMKSKASTINHGDANSSNILKIKSDGCTKGAECNRYCLINFGTAMTANPAIDVGCVISFVEQSDLKDKGCITSITQVYWVELTKRLNARTLDPGMTYEQFSDYVSVCALWRSMVERQRPPYEEADEKSLFFLPDLLDGGIFDRLIAEVT